MPPEKQPGKQTGPRRVILTVRHRGASGEADYYSRRGVFAAPADVKPVRFELTYVSHICVSDLLKVLPVTEISSKQSCLAVCHEAQQDGLASLAENTGTGRAVLPGPAWPADAVSATPSLHELSELTPASQL